METFLKWALGICAGLFTAFVLYALYFICTDVQAQTGVAGPTTEARINEGRVTTGYIETQAKKKPQPAEPERLGEIVYPGAALTDAIPLHVTTQGKLMATLKHGSGEALLDCESVQHKWVERAFTLSKDQPDLYLQHCSQCGVLRIAPEK